MLRLVPTDRLIDTTTVEAFEVFNKCNECCPVRDCDSCGPCADHPITDAGIAEEIPDSHWCEDCGHILDAVGMCPSCVPLSERSPDDPVDPDSRP